MNTEAVRRIVVGVMGHVDHGKTALVRALTGMETDRLEEERRRGISIALGFAHFTHANAIVDLIDMPGHERFVRTMVAGATGIDAALLVVAANEGVKPQTLEHLDVAAAMNVRRIIVAISKVDLVTPARTEIVARQAMEIAARLEIAIVALISVSVRSGDGVQNLQAALASLPAAIPPKNDGFAYLPIDRAFTLKGHGTIVTGTLRRGPLAAGETVQIVSGETLARIRGLQVHGQAVPIAEPGQRVAVNLREVAVNILPRGAALCAPGLLQPSEWLTAALSLTATAPDLANGAALRLLWGTAETGIRLRLLDRETLQPGEWAVVQFRAESPVSVPTREPFVLRRASPPLTLGGGRILDAIASRRRRPDPAWQARMAALRCAAPADFAASSLAEAGLHGITRETLARRTGIAPSLLPEFVRDACVRGETLFTRSALARATERLFRTIAEQSLGVSHEALARSRPEIGTALREAALSNLLATRKAVDRRGRIHRFDAAREASRLRSETASATALAQSIRSAGLSPPDLATTETRRILENLVRAGILVRATDRVQKREILFHREAIEQAKRQLHPALREGDGISVAQAGATLGISRKYSVPLLEYLDTIGFTRRIADLRCLAK